MSRIMENNQVNISGEIVSGFNFSHEFFGENFYLVYVKVQRLSNACDVIPVMVTDRLVNTDDDYTGQFVSVSGQFRSFNKQSGERKLLLLSVFAMEFDLLGENIVVNNDNNIVLDGFICNSPKYRETPLGREITDILLAVNRINGKSDYIPCICWGRNAKYASNLCVGTHISISGRVQSRKYMKKLDDEHTEERTAYEVSISSIKVVVDDEQVQEK